MDLWIRSQDKEKLLKVGGIQYQNCKLVENETVEANILISFHNSYDNEILGEYATKERALEVLDEIQNILRPKIKYTQNIKEDLKPEYTYKHFVSESSDIEVIQLNTYVYEMPKD